MSKRPTAALALALALLLAATVFSPSTARCEDGPFAQGSMRASVALGAGSTFGERYFIVGGSFGYFVLPGLELGVTGESWLGADPGVSKVGAHATYYLTALGTFYPYIGAFGRHWFIEDPFDDIDSVGARGGAAIIAGEHVVIGGGVVYEKYVNGCTNDCTAIYPELQLSLTF